MAVVIAPRFNGPPSSGHGGYSAGCAAAQLDAPAVEVTLRKPPPLGVPLSVGRDGETASLYDGHELIAEARPVELTVTGPGPVGSGVAAAASARFEWQDDHPFPTCFGCGPLRDDGLGLLPNRVGDNLVAALWTPGEIDEVLVWAALDCPGGWSHDIPGRPMVLGKMAAVIDRLPAVGEEHLVQGWSEGTEGRKVFTGSAIYDADGTVLAVAQATWITLQM